MQAYWNPFRKFQNLLATKKKRDGSAEAGVLCSYDAEDLKKIARGVSRGGIILPNFRLLATNWRGKSLRLRLMGLADNR